MDGLRTVAVCPGNSATRGLLATDHVILNHGQVTWTTPELAPPLLTTTPHQREDVSALDRFNVHRCPTRWVFSGTGLEPVTKKATVRYLYHSATAATLDMWERVENIRESRNLKPTRMYLQLFAANYLAITGHDINSRISSRGSMECGMMPQWPIPCCREKS
ncbi:uncharacterized protein TNCV_522951 [Trichonephila clavipes]|nr:uncharacterized protein TNCV_522951 [Trichonephila clavipes]